jgi:transposase-like protein
VLEKPTRRQFTAQYKLRVLQEAQRCSEPGQLGQLLRREGLYSSNLRTWKRQRERGELSGLSPKKRGRKAKRKDPVELENQELRAENLRLRSQLKKAQTIIEVQKKLSDVLGTPLAGESTSEKSE